jgi:uncharacterized membrane protein
MIPGRKRSRIRRYLTIFLGSGGGHAVAILLFIGYCLVFSYLSIAQHDSLETHAFDLGYPDQVVWNTAHGRPFACSLSTRGPNCLGEHFSPILALLAPLYWIWPDVRALLILQTVVIALGAFPVFWLARERLKSDLAGLSFSAALLLFPALEAANMFDFHAVTLATSFLLFAFYYMEKQRYKTFLLFALLAMACKEEMPLLISMMGLYLTFVKREWKVGSLAMVGGLAWFLAALYIVIPHFNAQGRSHVLSWYAYLGDGPLEIAITAVTNPLLILRTVLTPAKVRYIFDLLLPMAFTSLFSPQTLLLFLPSLAINLLSTYPPMSVLEEFHYAGPLVPFVIISGIYGVEFLARKATPLRLDGQKGPCLLSGLIFLASLLYHRYHGFTPLARHFQAPVVTARDRLAHELIASIPPEAAVSAQSNLVPHLSHREAIYLFPDPQTAKAEYVILDMQGEKYPLDADEYERALNVFLSSPGHDLVSEIQGFLFFQSSDEADIQYPLGVKFEEGIALLGFNVAVEDSEGAFSEEPLPLRLGDKAGKVRLTLWWEALVPIEEDYTVFTHLLDGEGRLIGGHDSMPANGWRPTSGWGTGQVMRDIHYIPFEAGHWGEIIIEVGLYDLETGRRLELEDGQDKVILGWLPE